MPKLKLFSYKTEGQPYPLQGRVPSERNPKIFYTPIQAGHSPNRRSRKAMFINKFK